MRVYAWWREESGLQDGRIVQRIVTLEKDKHLQADLDFVPGTSGLEAKVEMPAPPALSEPSRNPSDQIKASCSLTIQLPTGKETHVCRIPPDGRLSLTDLPPGKVRFGFQRTIGQDARTRIIETELPATKERDEIISFVANSQRGIMKGYGKLNGS